MHTVSVFSSQANLLLSDINRQDNKTLRAQFHIIFSNQRLISCQFAFTLPRMWRFYHHAVKESQAGTTGALISYTYCLHEMVCTYTDSAKMVGHFHKGHLETPLPKRAKWIFSLIPGIGGRSAQKVHPKCHMCCNAAPCFYVFTGFTYSQILCWISEITLICWHNWMCHSYKDSLYCPEYLHSRVNRKAFRNVASNNFSSADY